MKASSVGASGKLGRYMVQHALDRGHEVAGVCREKSKRKLDAFKGRITVFPGATNEREVIRKAVAGCDGVLCVLVPWGSHHYSSGTAQAVLDCAPLRAGRDSRAFPVTRQMTPDAAATTGRGETMSAGWRMRDWRRFAAGNDQPRPNWLCSSN